MSINSSISPEVMKEHRASWFVWTGDGSPGYPRQMIPRTATMRGQWGHDAKCSCGKWESRTGGATRRHVEDELFIHRFSAQAEFEQARQAK